MSDAAATDDAVSGAHHGAVPAGRWRALYEIGKYLTQLDGGAAGALTAVAGELASALPLRSVVLISALGGAPRRRTWIAAECDEPERRRAGASAAEAYAYLAGDPTPVQDVEEEGDEALPAGRGRGTDSFLVRLPLAADPRAVFGALQLDASQRLDEVDLFFLGAVVNQLGLALERHHAREARRARESKRRRSAESALEAAEVGRAEAERRHAAADALRAHFEELVDHLDRVFLWEADGATLHVTYVSARAETLLGYPRAQWLRGDEAPLFWVHDEDEPALRACIERALGTGEDQRCDHRCVTAAGALRWLHTGVHAATNGEAKIQATSIDITEVTEESSITRQERDFSLAIAHGLSEGVLAVDRRGRVTFLNRAAERLLGLTREETLGAPVRAILRVLGPDGHGVRDAELPWTRAMRSGAKQASDAQMLATPGRGPFPASYAASPLRYGGGVHGAVVTFQDASDRRRVEQTLRDSERQFRELAQTLPQIVWTLRPDGTVDFVNDRWEDHTGSPMTDEPTSWLAVVHPDDRERALEAARSGIAAGRDFSIEARLRHRDGTYRWYLNRSMVIHAAGGEPMKHVGTWTDVEDLKRAEAQARRQAAREHFLADVGTALGRSLEPLETAMATARAAVPAIADVCFVDVCADEGALERLATAVADPSARGIVDASAPGEGASAETPQARVLRDGVPILVPDFDGSSRDGLDAGQLAALREAGATSFMCVPLLGPDASLGVLTLARSQPSWRYEHGDLSLAEDLARRAALALDNARLHQTSQRAIRAREGVLAVVSHDLRTPLGGLLSAVALLEDDAPPESQKVLAMMQRQAQRMLRLVEDLLDLASLDAGRLSMQTAPRPIADLVSAALEVERSQAEAKGVALGADLEEEARAEVLCDEGRVQQVLVNLIGNAIKFTPPGGRITVAARPGEGEAIFSVTDTGPGMSEEELPHVFDRFWQAAGTKRHGTGLGLAIAKQIIRSHGGSIHVQSAPGKGTSFCFTLPLAPGG